MTQNGRKKGRRLVCFMSFLHWRTGKRVYRRNGKPFCVWL